MERCTSIDAKERGVVCRLDSHLAKVVNVSWNYAGRCESHKDEVMNAVLGLAGEAGEVADQMKKAYFHTDKGLNFHIDKLKLELGDVLFYWLKVADLFKLSVDEIIDANREKLESRHPELGKVTERFGAGAIR